MTQDLSKLQTSLSSLDFTQLTTRMQLIAVALSIVKLLESIPEIREEITIVADKLDESASQICKCLAKHGEKGSNVVSEYRAKFPGHIFSSHWAETEIAILENKAIALAKKEGISFNLALTQIGKNRALEIQQAAPQTTTENDIQAVENEARQLVMAQGISYESALIEIGMRRQKK